MASSSSSSSSFLKLDKKDWSVAEDLIFTKVLERASLTPELRYKKIAELLPHRTLQYVKMRCDELMEKKKKKDSDSDDQSSKIPMRCDKLMEKKMKDSDSDDQSSTIPMSGLAGQLLKENSETFSQLFKNFETNPVQDNINLLANVRDNLLVVRDLLESTHGPLHFDTADEIDHQLANKLLPPPFKN